MSLEPGQYERPITDGEIEQFFLNRIMEQIQVDDIELYFNISRKQAYKILDKFQDRHPDDCSWRDGPPIHFWVRPSIRSNLGDKAYRSYTQNRKEIGRKIAIERRRFDRA